jgi:hypothetical protein
LIARAGSARWRLGRGLCRAGAFFIDLVGVFAFGIWVWIWIWCLGSSCFRKFINLSLPAFLIFIAFLINLFDFKYYHTITSIAIANFS